MTATNTRAGSQLLAALSLLALCAGTAKAQTTIPDADWEVTSASLMIETATQVGTTCDVSGWGTSDASTNTGTVEAFEASGNFVCHFLVNGELPDSLSANPSASPATVTAHDTSVQTSIGTCSGDVTGEWQPDPGATTQTGTGSLIFQNAPWGMCYLNGQVDVEWPR